MVAERLLPVQVEAELFYPVLARVVLVALQMRESTRMGCAVRVLFPCRALVL